MSATVCISVHPPDSLASGGQQRARRLVDELVPTGLVDVAVLRPTDERTRAAIAATTGATVHQLSVRRRGFVGALLRWATRWSETWSSARADRRDATVQLDRLLAGRPGAAIWCIGVDAWLALPRRHRSAAIVDVYDLPSRNHAATVAANTRRLRRALRRGHLTASLGLLRSIVVELDGVLRGRLVEGRLVRGSRTVVVASPVEARSRPNVVCVPNGFDDVAPLPTGQIGEGEAHRFVFPALFSYSPNADAAEWFAEQVWPRVRSELPDATCVYAGHRPEWLVPLCTPEGIEMPGFVEDLGALLDTSIVIVPLLSGSGTRVKVIEAWARGVPVVSTAAGAEGLSARHGDDIWIADGAGAFAAGCVEVARSPELRRTLAREGRRRFEAGHRWGDIGARMRAELFAGTPSTQAS